MKSEPNYARLSDADADGFPVEKALLQHDSQERQLSKRQTSTPFLLHAGIILLEVVFGGLIIAGLISIHNARLSITAGSALNGLPQLNSYNTTMRFHNNSELLNDSKDADAYWQDLLQSGGVVSLNTEWAREQGLRPSAMSPTDSTQSIYQVDTFHALHCLNAIRQNLVPKTPPPWNEKHMLHCLDYIRHQLLCHPDITLVTTNDLEEFVLDETHTCKDYGAVVAWVDRHRWVEFPEWLKTKGAS